MDERRRQPRISLSHRASVTDLTHQVCLDPSEILDFSGRGMALLVSKPAPVNSAIRIDWDDALLLGYVCYHEPQGDRFRMGLQLNQALSGTRDIAQLLQQLQHELQVSRAVGQT